MLTKVRLKNFKLHADTTIEAAPVTIFIGPNNSGKSSIFQALLALRQAAARNSPDFCYPAAREIVEGGPYQFKSDQLVDIGYFDDVRRDGEKECEIEVAGRLDNEELQVSLQLQFHIAIRENRIFSHSGRISVSDGPPCEWQFVNGGGIEQSVTRDSTHFLLRPLPEFRLLVFIGTTGTSQPTEPRRNNQIGSWIAGAPQELLNSLHAVSPIRGFEEWGYKLPDDSAQGVERLTLPDRALSTLSTLAYRPDIEEQLADWFESLLGIRVKFQMVPPLLGTLRSFPPRNGGKKTPFSNEGTGANQIPFLLIPIGLAPHNHTILVSEPEAHLHPKAQSDVAKLLLKIQRQEHRQFFLETHSEHILHAFLNAVASGELPKEELAIYYFENVHGTAEVKRLEVDDQGRVKGGLPGFFDQSLREFREQLDAISKQHA
jgi:predicted ATPase